MGIKLSAKHIDKITLHQVCPDVFSNEDVGDSELWLNKFTFERGRNYTIEAGSGTGKSSLCSFIYLNRRDYRGTLSFDGHDVKRFSTAEICDLRQRHIALLPQELRLFPEISALDNIRLKNRLTGFKSEAEILEMLANLGIKDKADSLTGKLSIGQMQRVAIVRALCQPFDFILLDEPVSHLDKPNNQIVAELILDEAVRQGASIITTSVGNPLLLPETEYIKL